jgi:protein phosphatase
MDSLPQFSQQRVRQTVPARDLYDAQRIVKNLEGTGTIAPADECLTTTSPATTAEPTAGATPTAPAPSPDASTPAAAPAPAASTSPTAACGVGQ